MPLSDLAQAIPGLVVFGVLPGLAVATALVPRWPWWERLAMAPALSAGLAGVAGLLYHDVHAGFDATTYAPVVFLAMLAGIVRARRTGTSPRLGPIADRRTIALTAGVAIVAGCASAAILAGSLRNAPLPVERDSAIHGAVAVGIAQSHDTIPVIAEPVDQSAWSRTRTGLEAQAALVSELGGPPPAGALLPLTLLAVLLLPLAIAALAWETSGNALLAAAAAVLSLLSAFPAWPVSAGELPLVVGTGVVVPLVLAAARGLRGERTAAAIALAAACTAANWAVHGTEILTALVVGGPLLLAILWANRRAAVLPRAVAGVAACAGAAFAVALITRAPAVPSSAPDPNAGPAVPEQNDFAALVGHRSLSNAIDALTGFQPAWQLIAALAVIGAIAALRGRTMRWLVVAELVILTLFIDSMSVGVLRKMYVDVYPWATDDRLMNLQVFTLAPLAALGVVALANALPRLAARPGWRLAPAALAVSAAVLGLAHAGAIYSSTLDTHPVVTTADVLALHEMVSQVPVGAVVLSDDGDGGLWVSALTPQRLWEPWPYLRSHFDDARIAALGNACDASASVDPALFARIDVVYVGAREMSGLPRWDASCIGREPWLRRIVSVQSGGDSASVFVVDHGALARAAVTG